MAKRSGPVKVKKYGLEFKLKAVQLSSQPGVLIKDVAESLCIHPFMLSRWCKQVRDGELTGDPPEIEPPLLAALDIVEYRPPDQSDFPALRALLSSNGWEHRLGDEAWFAALLAAPERSWPWKAVKSWGSPAPSPTGSRTGIFPWSWSPRASGIEASGPAWCGNSWARIPASRGSCGRRVPVHERFSRNSDSVRPPTPWRSGGRATLTASMAMDAAPSHPVTSNFPEIETRDLLLRETVDTDAEDPIEKDEMIFGNGA